MSGRPSSSTSKWRWRIPSPIIFLILATRLSSSSFSASAQYIPSRPRDSRSLGRTRKISESVDRRDQKSTSRQLSINAYDDFCLFGPPDPFNYIWSSGLNVVSWCSKDGHGSRLIPDGTLHGVTYVKTKDYVQVSGTGDLTKINIAPGDVGGQFDSDSNTPEGSNVQVNGQPVGSWVTLISADTFCFRACLGDAKFCPSQYDQMGCWFLTGNAVGSRDTWQNCESESGDPPGMIGGKAYTQGTQPVPEPSAPELRNCQQSKMVSNGQPPPPLYDWEGDGEVATPLGVTGSGHDNKSDAHNAQDVNGDKGHESPSTTWLPVETCVPCQQQPLVASSTGQGGAGTTEQVGVTQMSGQVAALAKGTSSANIKASTPTPAKDQLDRRQEADSETVTKNGQCCHTTWTTSVVGGATTSRTAGRTAGGTSGGSKPSGTLSGTTTSGTLQVGGGGQSIVPTGQTGTVKPSGSGGLVSGNGTPNGTNSTGNDTGMGHRIDIAGLHGLRGVLLGVIGAISLGVLGGGWVLM